MTSLCLSFQAAWVVSQALAPMLGLTSKTLPACAGIIEEDEVVLCNKLLFLSIMN
jgi:hypothetical protein